jgi:hypothetical protein
VNTAVLLIDDDLGFAFWLGKALDRAGYQALPARNVTDAVALLSDFQTNPGLLIFGGDQIGAGFLVALWRRRHKNVRVMRLLDDGEECGHPAFSADIEYRKPAGRKEEDSSELLFAIGRMLASEQAV